MAIDVSVTEVYETSSTKVANKLLSNKWIMLDVYHTGDEYHQDEIYVLGKPVSFKDIPYTAKQAEEECSPYKDLSKANSD